MKKTPQGLGFSRIGKFFDVFQSLRAQLSRPLCLDLSGMPKGTGNRPLYVTVTHDEKSFT